MIFDTESNLRRLSCVDSTNFPLLQIDDENIESMGNIKYLGMQTDPSLKWKEQINLAIVKISRGIGMLKYSKRYLPMQTIQMMYFSIVDPHLRFCCAVRGGAGDTIIKNCKSSKTGQLLSSQTVLYIKHRCH